MSEQRHSESVFRRIPVDYGILAVAALVLAVLPIFMSQFVLSLTILTIYWAYLGTGWNIMGGYAGQFSFGHAAFYGIGAYTSSVLLVDHGVSPWIGMLVGAMLAAFAGLIMGFLFFQFGLKGHFFALGTFAIAEMFRLVSSELEVVNTSIGIHIPLIGGDDWTKIQFEETLAYYYYVIVGLFVLGTLITILVVRSKLGYYFLAIREDEDAAAALGVNGLVYKIIAVAISAALTAIGGSFFIQYFLFVDPSLAFGVAISIEILLRPIVGGVGTIWGPLAGALLLTPLEELTRRFVRNPPGFLDFIQGSAGVDVMIFGVLIIVVVLFMPDGIVGGLQRGWNRMRAS
jgi:branched-chain amino acid transport system permease protein